MADVSLKKQLLKLLEKDQSMRQPGAEWNSLVDSENTKKLKRIIHEHGWPGTSHVGEKAASAAWLIAQHSPELKFQKRCLKLIKGAVEKGEAKKEWAAYLTDRILIQEEKKQFFGTQFKVNEKKKKFVPHPIADPETLDERREEYNLEPFEKYRKKFRDEDVKEFINKFN